VHPLDLGSELVGCGGEVFADYEIVQQTLGTVTMRGSEPSATFGALDPLEASGLLRDLEMLTR